MKSLVPIRANVETILNEAEKDCIAWYILSGCSRAEAFVTFCRPELKGNKMMLDRVIAQFFGSEDVISYMESYKNTLINKKEDENINKTYSPEEMKSRKEKALQKLMNYVIEQSNNINDIENKDDIIKFADKLGLLDSDEEAIEVPRRYLPETCSRCRYKEFVEEHCVED